MQLEISKLALAQISESLNRDISSGFLLGSASKIASAVPSDTTLLSLVGQLGQTPVGYYSTDMDSVPDQCLYFLKVNVEFEPKSQPFTAYSWYVCSRAHDVSHSIDKEKMFIPIRYSLTSPSSPSENALLGKPTMKQAIQSVLEMLTELETLATENPEKWMLELVNSLPVVEVADENEKAMLKIMELIKQTRESLSFKQTI